MRSHSGDTSQISSRDSQAGQFVLWETEDFLPAGLPRKSDLRPAQNLLSILEDCHNYLYANEGMLNEKIFREILKLMSVKLLDEQLADVEGIRFGITASEYRAVLANGGQSFRIRIQELYSRLREVYPKFFSDAEIMLSPRSLAYVVQRIQFLSLTDTPTDVKGEAFQTFFTRYQRGDRGEFFTPFPIVDLAVALVDPKPQESLIDPACGSGAFLLQAVRHICKRYPQVSKSDYINENIRGIEFNPDIASAAQMRLSLEGATSNPILCANALEVGVELNGRYDIVLANPPFGSRGKIDAPNLLAQYDLGYRWHKTSSVQWHRTSELLTGQTPEILFVELCVRLLRPAGRLAIVLPDGILQNATTEHVRAWIRSQADVLAVISIPQIAFVPFGTGVKTSLLLLQKHPTEVNRVFMAIPQKIGYDVKGQPLYLRDSRGHFLHDEQGNIAVESDLPEVVRLYKQTQDGDTTWQSTIAFYISSTELNHRLDAEHYLPSDISLIDQIRRYPARRLCEVAEIVRDGDDFRNSDQKIINYIAISEVIPELAVVSSTQKVSSRNAPSRAKYRVRTGDIITAVSGASTGTLRHATAIITEDEDGAICTNGFAVLRNFSEVDPFYLLAYMRTDFFLRQIRRLLRGHAIPAITLDDLASILVPILPEEIESEIAQKMKYSIERYKMSLKNSSDAVNTISNLLNTSK